MKPITIQGKFALWAAALAATVVILFAGGTLLGVYHEQLEAVDKEIDVHRREVALLSRAQLREMSARDLVGLEPLMAILVTDTSGEIVRRSDGLPESLARHVVRDQAPFSVRDPDGRPWRVVCFGVQDHRVALAFRLDEVIETLSHLLLSYAASLPFVLAIAGLGGWWVAGRAVVPLRGLTVAAEAIGIEALDRRVPVPPSRDELARLATVLNAMLTRLESGFRQAQRFAADASHELRTPLTVMHGEIERLLRAPHLDPALEPKLLSLQEEIARLDRITQQLLLLARFDSGEFPLARETTDFSDLVTSACEDAELLAVERRLTIHHRITPGLEVAGDPAHLRRAVLTLLDNATRYNHDHGRVECRLTPAGAGVELRVGNTGPGIPADAVSQLFQRFFRADPARRRGGHGLGLSLAREIVRAHHGDLTLAPSETPGWTEFVLTLPFRPAADSLPAQPAA